MLITTSGSPNWTLLGSCTSREVGAKGAFPGRRNPLSLPVHLQAGTIGERNQEDAPLHASFSLFALALGGKQQMRHQSEISSHSTHLRRLETCLPDQLFRVAVPMTIAKQPRRDRD